MDLTLDAHEREVSGAARGLLSQIMNEEAVRSIEDEQSAEAMRKVMLGIGSGGWLAGPNEEDLFGRLSFFAESGAALVPGLASMAVGAAILADLADDGAVRAEMESGTALVSALAGYAGGSRPPGVTLDERSGGELRLHGIVPMAEFGAIADVCYVLAQDARDPSRQACVLVDTRRHEIERRGRSTFGNDFRADLLIDITLSSDEVICTSDEQKRWAKVRSARDVIAAIRVVECAGGARAVTKRTVNYVNTRHQFGKPLGHFQAVKQRAANMLILSEGAFLLASEALAKVSGGVPRPVELEWAKSWVARAYKDVTLSAHQLHGGMGYARESGLFRWSERAKLRQLELEADVDASMFANQGAGRPA